MRPATIAAVAAALLLVTGCPHHDPKPRATDTPTDTDKPKPPPGASAALPVEDVVDGDTFKVRDGDITRTVRIIGLDTPETKDPRKPVQCYGPQASDHAHELLDGKRVRLESDPTQDRLDKYGRTLAYVWLPDDRLYEQVMIRSGFGREYTYDKPYRYQERLRAAQAAARHDHAGLWGTCPIAGDAPVPAGKADHRYATCFQAGAAGLGPYRRGKDPEYAWYRDSDGDGIACEH